MKTSVPKEIPRSLCYGYFWPLDGNTHYDFLISAGRRDSPRGTRRAPWSTAGPRWTTQCRPESEGPSATHQEQLYAGFPETRPHLVQRDRTRRRTLSGFTRESILPSSMSAISCRIPSRASQYRSISALSSDSVGSIMRVPATGHDMVGAWKPGRKHGEQLK